MAVPRRVIFVLILGVMAASQSGNLIRIGDAPAVAIAAWRLVLATLLFIPFAGRGLKTVRFAARRDLVLLVLAGAALAGHFIAWIAAVQHTTVANAAIFFAMTPVLTAVGGYLFFKERTTFRLVVSILLGLLGVAVLGAADLSLRPEHVTGDALAVLSAVLFTAYFLLGKAPRQRVEIEVYVTVLYAVAALVGIIAMALQGLPAFDYSGRSWLCFALMALVPTMLGHTSFNYALRYVDTGRIAATTLAEPFLAGVVAFFVWDEPVGGYAIVGYVLVSASVLVLGFKELRGFTRFLLRLTLWRNQRN